MVYLQITVWQILGIFAHDKCLANQCDNGVAIIQLFRR